MKRKMIVKTMSALLGLALSGCGGGGGGNDTKTSGVAVPESQVANYSWHVDTMQQDAIALIPGGSYDLYQDQPILDWLQIDGAMQLSYRTRNYLSKSGWGNPKIWSSSYPFEAYSNVTVSARSGEWLIVGWYGQDGHGYLRLTGPDVDTGPIQIGAELLPNSLHLAIAPDGSASAAWAEAPSNTVANAIYRGHFSKAQWINDPALTETADTTRIDAQVAGPDGAGWYFFEGQGLTARYLDPQTGFGPANSIQEPALPQPSGVFNARAIKDGTGVTALWAYRNCIAAARFDGKTWGPAMCINDPAVALNFPNVTVAANASGQAVAAWGDDMGTTVYMAYRSAADAAWTKPVARVLAGGAPNSLASSITSSGVAAIGFMQYVSGSGYQTVVTTSMDGATWSGLSQPTLPTTHPAGAESLGFAMEFNEVGHLGVLQFFHSGDHDLVEFNTLADKQWGQAQLLQKDIDLADGFPNGVRMLLSSKRLVAMAGQRWAAFWETRGSTDQLRRSVVATFD